MLSEAYRRILVVFAQAGGPLRGKAVCEGVGAGTAANQVEAMRSKLKRLTERGILVESEPGLLIRRLQTGRCELCRRTDDIKVHHVRKLADLDTPGRPQPPWVQEVAKRRRKSLVVCDACHNQIHGESVNRLTQ